MKTIVWRVEATAAPVAVRPCGKCGAEAEFCSTGAFRVNAQKKRLDVWLIYRCSTCGCVWNCAVISRGRPENIADEELEKYFGNDARLALRCALDVGLLKRNGARRGRVEFVVKGPGIDEGEDCRVRIESGGLAGIRLADVLRQKLAVSRSELERLAEAGRVSIDDGSNVLSAKLKRRQDLTVRAKTR